MHDDLRPELLVAPLAAVLGMTRSHRTNTMPEQEGKRLL